MKSLFGCSALISAIAIIFINVSAHAMFENRNPKPLRSSPYSTFWDENKYNICNESKGAQPCSADASQHEVWILEPASCLSAAGRVFSNSMEPSRRLLHWVKACADDGWNDGCSIPHCQCLPCFRTNNPANKDQCLCDLETSCQCICCGPCICAGACVLGAAGGAAMGMNLFVATVASAPFVLVSPVDYFCSSLRNPKRLRRLHYTGDLTGKKYIDPNAYSSLLRVDSSALARAITEGTEPLQVQINLTHMKELSKTDIISLAVDSIRAGNTEYLRYLLEQYREILKTAELSRAAGGQEPPEEAQAGMDQFTSSNFKKLLEVCLSQASLFHQPKAVEIAIELGAVPNSQGAGQSCPLQNALIQTTVETNLSDP